jgi:hypothetical protein
MSLLRRLFGGKSGGDDAPPPPGEEYKGCRITPTPIREGGQYRISARIEKEVEGRTLRHDLIRADTAARQMIDQLGDGVFR